MLGFLLAGLMATANVQYSSPVNYKVTLAGNFGEPRPNHFHGGIDVKTDGVEGKHIYSIGDGYVSRLTVGLYGFGNAVYVTHPEGYVSVYCHLKHFAPRLERLVKRTGKSDEQIDLRFDALQIPVAQGQLIAVSGNTGHSKAPHLHLEIHDARSDNMLDPLDFLGACVNDSVPPQAHCFMAVPMAGEGVFNGGGVKQTFGFSSHELSRSFTAWGRVGFAIWGNDYMQNVYNHYGIRETILLVDDREVFHSVVDNIPVFRNRQVNSWGDYAHWRRFGPWYLRSYIPRGVNLPFLQADENRGIVVFNEERPYRLTYVLRDVYGNESRYSFTVTGKHQDIRPTAPVAHNVSCDRLSVISRPGMRLVIPAGNVEDVLLVDPVVEEGFLSPSYLFSRQPCPLFGWAELSIAVRQKVKDPSLLYISSGGKDLGGTYHDGWITTMIRDLGASYEVKLKSTRQ